MAQLVQSATNSQSGATTTTVTLGKATTAGNCLIVAIATEDPATFTISGITLGGAADHFASLKSVLFSGSGNFTGADIWADPNCVGGQTSVVVTASVASAQMVWVYEWSGLPSTIAALLDQSASSTGSSSAWSSTASPTTLAPSEVWIGCASIRNSVTPVPVPTGPGAPWANLAVLSTGTLGGGISGYQVTSSPGAATFSGTETGGTLSQTAAAVVTLFTLPAPALPATPGPSWRQRFQPWRKASQQRVQPPQPVPAPVVETYSSVPGIASPGAFEPGYPGLPPVPPQPFAPPAALPGPSWQRRFQPWRKAAQLRAQPPPVITCSGSIALAPMALSAAAAIAAAGGAPLSAAPGLSWQRVYQPWRRVAQTRVFPPAVITCTGSVALAPMGLAASGSGSPEMAPAVALPGPSWQRVFQPGQRAALVRSFPPPVITVSGSIALAPIAVAGSVTGSPELAPAAALPGPAWRRTFQPWRRAAQAQAQPAPVITCMGSIALAAMALAGTESASPEMAPAAALPAAAWRRVFQPWRRAATERVQPPAVVTCTGSVAFAPLAIAATETASPEMAPPAALPGQAWRRVFQPWRRASQAQALPPAVITVTGSAALAPMALSGSASGSPELAPAAAFPGPAWKHVFQPWRRAAQSQQFPPVTITCSGSAALAPMTLAGAVSDIPPALVPPAAAFPGPAWRLVFQPWRKAATARVQPPAVITVSGSVALAPVAVTGSESASAEMAPAAATPGPSWRRHFQPWRKAAGTRVQPPAVITAAGSVALAPMVLAGNVTGSPELAPAAALPGSAWRQVFQPWRKAAQQRVQPPAAVTATGSVALATLAMSGTGSEIAGLVAPAAALPGPSWRARFQPWRRAALQRVQPPQPVTCSGSVALAPAAVNASAAVATVSVPTAAAPGLPWQRVFQPWLRAAAVRVIPPPVITASGSIALAPMAVAGAGTAVFETSPPAASPGSSWRKVYQPWRRASQLRQVPPPVSTCTGSIALAPVTVAASAAVTLPVALPANPGPAWRRVYQPWRKAAQQRMEPPPAGAAVLVTATGSIALAPMSLAASGTDTSLSVTATGSGAFASGIKLRILVFTSAAVAAGQNGGAAANFPASGTYDVSVPVAATGSYIVGSMLSVSATSFTTGQANSTILDNIQDATNNVTHGSFISNALTNSTGAAFYGATTTWNTAGGTIGAEIKAAAGQTLTRASAAEPAVVTSTSGSTIASGQFTPPPGSIVVALVDALTTGCTVTDSSRMTWTPLVQAGPSGYAGIFLAQVPYAPPAPSPAALPGPSWRRRFQPWRRAAGLRVQPPAVITCTGSAALAPMATAASATVIASLAPAAVAMPGPSWRKVFQPWRRGVAVRVQPPTVTVSGSAALAPMSLAAGPAAVSTVTAPPALPGPSWRRRFQPWRRAALSRAQPPPVTVCAGSMTLAPMAITSRLHQSAGEVWRAPDRLNKSGGTMA